MTRILAFAGSSRSQSWNQRVLGHLVTMATDAGAQVSRVDLGELDIPIYNADLEAAHGLPEGARRLRGLLSEHEALMIGCPEYNGFITPLLLNCIDWATRDGKAADLEPFADKPVLIASASPGAFGGMRSAGHLRTLLAGVGCMVLPQTLAVPRAAQAFAEDGNFRDEGVAVRARKMVFKLVDIAGKLA